MLAAVMKCTSESQPSSAEVTEELVTIGIGTVVSHEEEVIILRDIVTGDDSPWQDGRIPRLAAAVESERHLKK
jgi:hypothetical protein